MSAPFRNSEVNAPGFRRSGSFSTKGYDPKHGFGDLTSPPYGKILYFPVTDLGKGRDAIKGKDAS
jgi:hypothetical protein